MSRDSSEDFMYAMQTPKQRPAPRQHYTPANVSEEREMRRGVIFIVVIIALIGLAGGIAS